MTIGPGAQAAPEVVATAGEGLRIASAEELARTRAELAEWLGVDVEIPRTALIAALVHPGYRRRLDAVRGSRAAVEALLARAPQLPASAATMAGVGPEEEGTGPAEHGARELLSRATMAVVRWGASGFAVSDEATRARRLAACGACPHLADAPDRGVHRATRRLRRGAKVCGRCGCAVEAKVRLASEACPVADPANAALTRWGEPREQPVLDLAVNRPKEVTA
jgi:hypothetical protein